jgi:hypothetical protein
MVDAEVVDTRLFGDQAARAWGGVSFQKLYSIKFVVSAFEDKDGNAYHVSAWTAAVWVTQGHALTRPNQPWTCSSPSCAH